MAIGAVVHRLAYPRRASGGKTRRSPGPRQSSSIRCSARRSWRCSRSRSTRSSTSSSRCPSVRIDRRAHIFLAAVFLAMIMSPGLIADTFRASVWRAPASNRRLTPSLRQARNLHAYEAKPRGDESRGQAAPALRCSTLSGFPRRCRRRRSSWGVTAGSSIEPSVRHMRSRRQTRALEMDSADPLRHNPVVPRSAQARGIRLLVVPGYPTKRASIPGMLARRAEGTRESLSAKQTRRLLEKLEQYGIEYVDLFEVFRSALQEQKRFGSEGRLYLAQDSHWSCRRGARVAAPAAVAPRLKVLDGGLRQSG